MSESVESPSASDRVPGPGGASGGAVLLVIAVFVLGTAAVIAGFMRGWRPAVAAAEGAGIDSTITYLLVATGGILIAGHGVMCWFLWKGAGRGYRRPSARAEWLWGLMPVVLMLAISEAGVLVVSGPVLNSLFAEKPENPVRAEVLGKQFEWIVRYPGKDGTFGNVDLKYVHNVDNPPGLDDTDEAALDDVLSGRVLRVPLGRPCVLTLRTQDVIHSFFVPDFRVKQDLIPGFATRIKFTPTKQGVYEIVCAELCGLGHYRMRGEVHVLDPDEYDAWIAGQDGHFGG